MKLRYALLMTLALGAVSHANEDAPVRAQPAAKSDAPAGDGAPAVADGGKKDTPPTDTSTPNLFACDSSVPLLTEFPTRFTNSKKQQEKWGKAPYTLRVPTNYTAVKVTEVSRKSRLEEDFEKVRAAAGKGLRAPDECFLFSPKFKRANITIEYTGDNLPGASHKIVTGPEEHIYLSADMPVTNIKQLQYDAASGGAVEKDTPSTFYIGVNYRMGDLASGDPEEFFSTDRISFKLMAQASKHPNESMGGGVGYDLGPVELFVAYLWTQDEEGTYTDKPGHSGKPVFGISFNIDKGIGWLKD